MTSRIHPKILQQVRNRYSFKQYLLQSFDKNFKFLKTLGQKTRINNWFGYKVITLKFKKTLPVLRTRQNFLSTTNNYNLFWQQSLISIQLNTTRIKPFYTFFLFDLYINQISVMPFYPNLYKCNYMYICLSKMKGHILSYPFNSIKILCQ